MHDEIPSTWQRSFLGKIGKWSGGGTPSKGNKLFWTNGTIPWVSPKDMKCNLISDAEDYITEEAVKQSSTKLYPVGAVLIVTRSGILRKKVPVAVAIRPVAVNQDIKVLLPNNNIDTQFVANYLWGQNQHLLFRCAKDGTTVESIDTSALMNFPIPVPPLPEQQKIAQILSTWDKAIEKLESLITAKQKRKKALMQQLLTGKKRFTGFEGEWEKKTLGEIANFRRGSFPQPYGLPKWYDETNGFPFIQVYDIDKNMRLKPETKNKISSEAIEQSVFIPKDTLIISIQGSIGRVAITQYDAYVDRTVLLFSEYLLPTDIVFFSHILHQLFEIEKTKAPGGTIKTITKEVLSDFVVKFPPLKEQQKIASVLSAADKEIEIHQNQLSALKQQKKGLMQQLLTGKKRVKIDEPVQLAAAGA